MSQPTDHEVSVAMIVHGGSFAQKLGACFQVADPQNQARIKVGFPALWAEYEELASMLAKRKADAAAR
jgi:hypothetical protein